MSSKTLARVYEARSAAMYLEDLIASTEESGGDITSLEESVNALAEKAESLPLAVDDLISLVKEIEFRAEARKAEADRLRQRAKRDEAVAEWFKGQVQRLLQEQSITKIETPRFRITVATAGGKQPLEIVGEVPTEFTREKVVVEIDKDAIRAELEKGTTLPFALLAPKSTYLRIS